MLGRPLKKARDPALVCARLILGHCLDLRDEREILIGQLNSDLSRLLGRFAKDAEPVVDRRLHDINSTLRIASGNVACLQGRGPSRQTTKVDDGDRDWRERHD